MNQLSIRPSFMPSEQEFSQISSLCKTLATAPHYSKLGGGGVLAIWLTAREMNLPPMLCLNGGMYTFSGAVSLSSNLINMLIDTAGHRADVIELTDKICVIEFVRNDRKEGEGKRYRHQFTIEDARLAGLLGKDNWRKFPKSMLYSRCLSAGGKIHMPMVLMGVYAHGEIGDNESQDQEIAEFEVKNSILESPKNQLPSPTKPEIPHIDEKLKLDFIKKNDLIPYPDGSISSKLEYLKYTSKKSKASEESLIERACQNPKLFNDMYEKWKRENLSPKFPDLPKIEPVGLEIFSM